MTGRKSVLTTENKGQIILLKKQGLSVRKIAVEVGISKSAVSNFLKTAPVAVAPVAPTSDHENFSHEISRYKLSLTNKRTPKKMPLLQVLHD